MSEKVNAMQRKVERHLDEMASLFVPGVRVTFIARFPDDEEGRCDVLITNDDEREVLNLVKRRVAAEVEGEKR